MLALHGFGGSPSELGFLLDRLGNAGYAVSAPLLPGHGTSPRDLQSRTFADWLEAARENLRHVRASHERVAVLGFSMGSLLALSLGAEPGERGGVAGVVVIGCALRLRAPLRAAFGLATATRVRLPDAYVPKPPPDLRDKTLAAAIEAYDRHPIRAAMEVHRAGTTVAARLADIRCPVLALHGERDRVCDPRASRDLAMSVSTRDVRVRTYRRSGHTLALDFDREEVATEVLSFCERVQTRPVEP